MKRDNRLRTKEKHEGIHVVVMLVIALGVYAFTRIVYVAVGVSIFYYLIVRLRQKGFDEILITAEALTVVTERGRTVGRIPKEEIVGITVTDGGMQKSHRYYGHMSRSTGTKETLYTNIERKDSTTQTYHHVVRSLVGYRYLPKKKEFIDTLKMQGYPVTLGEGMEEALELEQVHAALKKKLNKWVLVIFVILVAILVGIELYFRLS